MQPENQPPVEQLPPEQIEQTQLQTEQIAPQSAEVQPVAPSELPQVQPVVWEDIEYIQHDQSPLWYVGFVLVVAALMAVAILLQAWTFVVLILVMAVALVIYVHRPPRTLTYSWSQKGLTINDQLHPAGEFKSFGVIKDGEHNALVFIPVKRFRPGLTVYFPNEIGEQLVDTVGAFLPMQELHLDAFDRLLRKLHI